MENTNRIVTADDVSGLPSRDTFTGKYPANDDGDLVFMPIAPHERNDKISAKSPSIYLVYASGIVPSGHKVCVIIKNIPVYCDVAVPEKYLKDDPNKDTFGGYLKTKMNDEGKNFKSIETKYGRRLKGFQLEPTPWKRVYFNNIYDRAEGLKLFEELSFTTASDDSGFKDFYFPLIARTYRFNTCNWNRIAAGKYRRVSNSMVQNMSAVYEVNLEDFIGMEEKQITDLAVSVPAMIKDPTVVMAWDIETYTHGAQTGDAPRAEDTNYSIFMIAAVFSWQYSSEPLMRVCLLNQLTEYPKSMAQGEHNYVVVCKDEKTLLEKFIEIAGKMRPDISVAFNGGGFDWPLVREKCARYGLMKHLKKNLSMINVGPNETEIGLKKSCFREEKVKISAEEPKFAMLCAQYPGLLDTDCMVVFKQLYPTAEVGKGGSLNFYLKMNKLEGKEDMPYKRMFRIYELSDAVKAVTAGRQTEQALATLVSAYKRDQLNAEERKTYEGVDDRTLVLREMSLVCYYCVIDAYRCQQLYVARSIVDDKRELSNMSYVSLYDSFYRANGMKVRNLIARYCNENGIMFSNAKTNNEKIKYPGAWVFRPKKGLNNRRPTTALDASSLYPSLMMVYNLSPDKAIIRVDDKRKTADHIANADAMADELRKRGYELHHVKFHCPTANVDVEGWTVRHHGNHTVSHEGQTIIDHYETKPEGGFVKDKTGALVPVRGREALPGESMGIFPFILKKLFDRRAELKKVFVALSKLKEKCETEMKKSENRENGKVLYERFLTAADIALTGFTDVSQVEYKEVCFRRNKVDSKQKAMKVHMNTFYGESGNYLSPIYELLVAGGITTAGQNSIKEVSSYLTQHEYDVRYGDTDSNYICPPDKMFADVDKLYEAHRAVVDERIAKLDGLPTKEVSRAHWKRIDEIYGKVDKQFAEDIKAKKATRQQYYCNEQGWIDALKYVDGVVSSDIPDIEKLGCWMALRSRNREDYWIKMVQITRCDIEELRVRVNDHLSEYNGTEFLKMAYEEVLFPAVFTGKKKYFGFQHLERENFHPKDSELFIKGVDIVKQGQTQLAKEEGYSFIHEICSVDNYSDIREVILRRLKELCARKFDTKYFIKTAKYKKPKEGKPGNKAVLCFVERMKEARKAFEDVGDYEKAALYKVPDWGDRIFYVVVKRDASRDLRGRKVDPKISDKMEFVEVYEASLKTESPLEIDIDYYMDSSIYGLFARFLSYLPEFEPVNAADIDWDDKEAYKEYDEYIIKTAKKYIESFCYDLVDHIITSDPRAKQYRDAYQDVTLKARANLVDRLGNASFVICGFDMYDDKSQAANRTGQFNLKGTRPLDRVRTQIEAYAEVSRVYGENVVDNMIKRGVSLTDAQCAYMSTKATSMSKMISERSDAAIKECEAGFASRIDRFMTILEKYDKGLTVIINERRAASQTGLEDEMVYNLNTFSESDVELLNALFELTIKWITHVRMRKQMQSVCISITRRLSEMSKQAANVQSDGK